MNFGLELVKKLKPCAFHWKAPKNDGKTHFGFIAQDVNEILPRNEFGIVNIMNTYLTLEYYEFIPLLTKAIQELAEKNEKLEKELEDLKNEKHSNNS